MLKKRNEIEFRYNCCFHHKNNNNNNNNNTDPLTADFLDDLDTLGYGHVASLPSAQYPVDLASTARPIAVTLVALEAKALADIVERLRYFRAYFTNINAKTTQN